MSASTPFQLLTRLPTPLLALVASHVDISHLLLLQRCSSSLQRLCGDESYMTISWRWVNVSLSTHTQLLMWALPVDECILNLNGRKRLIPARLWQAALPVFRAVVAVMTDVEDERYTRLRQLLRNEQPTKQVRVERTRDGQCRVVNHKNTQSSVEVRRVDVLSDISRGELEHRAWSSGSVELRCLFVLRACPNLQHLRLEIDTDLAFPSHEDTFALVPSLRSLALTLYNRNRGCDWKKSPVDFPRMLDSLPHLTAMRCINIRIGVDDILAIACHSTLDELHIESSGYQLDDADWLGQDMSFHSTAQEHEEQTQPFSSQGEHDKRTERALAVHVSSTEEQKELEKTELALQRMRAALIRTQPSGHSCTARLELAEWLHGRLWRSEIFTNETDGVKWLTLQHFRTRVALLRATLQAQLR